MTAFNDLYNTVRAINQTPSEYVREFEENYKILKAQGGELSHKLLAATLLSHANLPEEKLQLMKSNLQFYHKVDMDPEALVSEIKEALRNQVDENEHLVKKLPREIWLKVFGYLYHDELLSTSTTCKEFHKLCMDPSLWTELHIDVEILVYKFEAYMTLMRRATMTKTLLIHQQGHFSFSDSFVRQSQLNIVQILGLAENLQTVDVHFSGFDDNLLMNVANSCPQLKTIDLGVNRKITDEGISVLVEKCPNLESLNLCDTFVTNAGFLKIAEHGRKLKFLNACLTDILDDGLYTIGKNCKKLEEMIIVGDRGISDEGLANFVKIAINLRVLSVTRSLYRQETINMLKKINPKLTLFFSREAVSMTE